MHAGRHGGVYTAEDALKLVMAGADVVHVCGAILKHGPDRIAEIREGMARTLCRCMTYYRIQAAIKRAATSMTAAAAASVRRG